MGAGRLAAMVVEVVWRRRIGPRYNQRTETRCRFHPNCSRFAVVAFLRHGVFRGALLTFRRVRRCHPRTTDSCIDYPPKRKTA